MRAETEIRVKLRQIDEDERFHYPPANIFSNAPLTLIQMGLEAAAEVLQWVLDETSIFSGPKREHNDK